jgi:hypothetical protein
MMNDTKIDEQKDTRASHAMWWRDIRQTGTPPPPPAHVLPTSTLGICKTPNVPQGVCSIHPHEIEFEHDESWHFCIWYRLYFINVVCFVVNSCGYVIQCDVLSMQGSASAGSCWQGIVITCYGETGIKGWLSNARLASGKVDFLEW